MSIWTIDIRLEHVDDDDPEKWVTTAEALLSQGDGTSLTGYGRARRDPDDRTVPAIGEELAAARALRHLADQLLRATSDDISAIEHRRVHLSR